MTAPQGERPKGRGRVVGVIAVIAALFVVPVVVHDAACYVRFSPFLLCERPDGSLWRDGSHGCYGFEDPACGAPCVDSTPVSEGPRRSCGWLLMKVESPTSGEPPHYTGPSPGSGQPA